MGAHSNVDMNMNCGRVRADLSAYAFGALDAASAARIAQHLEGCPECRLELQQQRQVVQGLLLSARQNAPAGLKANLMAQVAVASARQTRKLNWWQN